MIKPLRRYCLLSALICVSTSASGADNALSLQAKASPAELAPRDEQQHQVRLPALDATVIATVLCAADARPVSLTVSISDSYRHFGPELLADSKTVEALFNLPAGQLAPVSVAEFCIKGVTADGQVLELPGVATAQVSLRCQSEDASTSMHFASLPIPVSLYCRAGDDADYSSLDK